MSDSYRLQRLNANGNAASPTLPPPAFKRVRKLLLLLMRPLVMKNLFYFRSFKDFPSFRPCTCTAVQ